MENEEYKENKELKELADGLKYSEEKRKEINKIYKVKGHGKQNKLQACQSIAVELKKLIRDCYDIKELIEIVKKAIVNEYGVNDIDSINDFSKIASYKHKMQKEIQKQENIIKNKDFGALVKDVNKSIMAEKLFVVLMTKSVEKASKFNDINYLERIKELNFIDKVIDESSKILENQLAFNNQELKEVLSFINGDKNVEINEESDL